MIKAAIFDMDGLLIDSEPLWGRAKDKVLDSLNVKLTTEDVHATLGQGIHNAVDYWYHKHPWSGQTPAEVTEAIIEEFLRLVKAEAQLKPGVHQAIDVCKDAGLPLAIASSSPKKVIDVVVDKVAIRDLFNQIYSAHNEPFSKPHPGVFITVAEVLDVPPLQCAVFEDAPSGVLAAKSAKMQCIAVPEPEVKNHPFIQIADVIIDSLEEFDAAMLSKL